MATGIIVSREAGKDKDTFRSQASKIPDNVGVPSKLLTCIFPVDGVQIFNHLGHAMFVSRRQVFESVQNSSD